MIPQLKQRSASIRSRLSQSRQPWNPSFRKYQQRYQLSRSLGFCGTDCADCKSRAGQ